MTYKLRHKKTKKERVLKKGVALNLLERYPKDWEKVKDDSTKRTASKGDTRTED